MTAENSAVQPTVAVVSVTYNRRADMESLLRQLQDIDYPQDKLSIYIVDNASTDGTADFIRESFPHVHLIESKENSGIAPGFNQGIRAALAEQTPADYIWLLDSDVGLSSDSLRPLVQAMRNDPSLGIVGSSVYDPERRDRLVTAGMMVNWKTGEGSFVLPTHDAELIDVDLIPACSLMARSSLCQRLGPWDELLRLYWGDTEWCLRFHRAGYRVRCCVASRAWHRDWSSIRRGFFAPAYLHDHLRGALLFHIRHDPSNSLAGTKQLILKSYFRSGLEQLTMRLGFSRAYDLGVQDFFNVSFAPRDSAALFNARLLPDMKSIAQELKPRMPAKRREPRWMIWGFPDPQETAMIQAQFEQSCGPITWCLPPQPSVPTHTAWSEFRIVKPRQLWQLVGGLLTPWRRVDVMVTDVSSPNLRHLASARYTVFLDRQRQGVICRNRILPGLAKCLMLWLRGIKAAYLDLPRRIRQSPSLARAIDQGEIPPSTLRVAGTSGSSARVG